MPNTFNHIQLQNLKLIKVHRHIERIKYFTSHEVYKNICFEIINSLLKIYIVGRLLFGCRINLCKKQSNTGNSSCSLLRKKYCVASCDCLLTVLPPSRAVNFMLQKVEATPTFCKSIFVAREGGNTVNKQSHLATRHFLRGKLQENVALITWPQVL